MIEPTRGGGGAGSDLGGVGGGGVTDSESELPSTWLSLKLGDVLAYGKTEKAEPEEIAPETWVLELLIRRELFMRPHRRHACRQSTSGPALACSPTSSCVLSPPRAAWPWFAPEPCCQSHASNRH